MQLEEMKQYLKEKLQREPEVLQIGTGQFMVEYFSYGAPVREFLGSTEEEALGKLANYFRTREPLSLPVEEEKVTTSG